MQPLTAVRLRWGAVPLVWRPFQAPNRRIRLQWTRSSGLSLAIPGLWCWAKASVVLSALSGELGIRPEMLVAGGEQGCGDRSRAPRASRRVLADDASSRHVASNWAVAMPRSYQVTSAILGRQNKSRSDPAVDRAKQSQPAAAREANPTHRAPPPAAQHHHLTGVFSVVRPRRTERAGASDISECRAALPPGAGRAPR